MFMVLLYDTIYLRVHVMNVEQRQVTADPDLGCYCLHPLLLFITTQPKS